MSPSSPKRSDRECGGFTLIEVMVSAILIGIVIMGATSLIATGRTLDSVGRLRAQALRLASNSMERATHHNSAFPISPAPQVITTDTALTTESGATCPATQIDSVYGIATVQWTEADGGTQGVDVTYQRICVKVNWTCGGLADSVVLRKRIANVR
jgi:prepilin-type N-terminal cleavage/methylation domain-containing protein